MTTAEFSHHFDTLIRAYDIPSGFGGTAALSFDEYEKSLFLTNAQRKYVYDIVKNGQYDANESVRRTLNVLIKQGEVNSFTSVGDNSKLTTDSIMVLGGDILYILQEELTGTYQTNSVALDIVPLRIDEYNIQKRNPFKKPKAFGLNPSAWRIETSNTTGSQLFYELILPSGITSPVYRYRYLAQPAPIILETLSGVDIEGATAENTSQLNSSCHLDILRMAVDDAIKSKQLIYNK